MSRLRWTVILSCTSSYTSSVRCSRDVRNYRVILGIVLSIFLLFEGWGGFQPGQVLAVANQQLAANNVELSTQVLQMAVGPEQVSFLNINLANPRVRLGVVQANNRLSGPGEVLTSMASRTAAVAGINGDFFDGMHSPIGLVVINGQIVQSAGYHAVLGVTASKQITMGLERFAGSVAKGKVSHVLNSINHRGDTNNGNLVLFTPALGSSLSCLGATIVMLQPVTASTGVYTVRTIQPNATTLPVLSNQEALVGSGETGKWLASNLHPGDQINIAKRIVPNADLVQAIGGGPVLIKNGAIYNDPNPPTAVNARNPLTAIGVNKNGTRAFFVVFDGRLSGPSRSRGLTPAEMAKYLLTRGAYQAMLFDGGGSSEMVARLAGQQRASVINYPSDGRERPVANGLFVYY